MHRNGAPLFPAMGSPRNPRAPAGPSGVAARQAAATRKGAVPLCCYNDSMQHMCVVLLSGTCPINSGRSQGTCIIVGKKAAREAQASHGGSEAQGGTPLLGYALPHFS